MPGLRPKNQRQAAVIEAARTAFNEGKRAGVLIEVIVDKVDEVRSAEGLPSASTEMLTRFLMLGGAMGDDWAAVEKTIIGFNII